MSIKLSYAEFFSLDFDVKHVPLRHIEPGVVVWIIHLWAVCHEFYQYRKELHGAIGFRLRTVS